MFSFITKKYSNRIFNMSSMIGSWYEKDPLKEHDKSSADIYFYEFKTCLANLKEDNFEKCEGFAATCKMNCNLHKHLRIVCKFH